MGRKVRADCGETLEGNVVWSSQQMLILHNAGCQACAMARVHAASQKEEGDAETPESSNDQK